MYEWKSNVGSNLCAQITEDEIFNATKMCLFCILTPDKTLKFKGEKCIGGKPSKARIKYEIFTNDKQCLEEIWNFYQVGTFLGSRTSEEK